ncbi:hypothethical protein (plasmid) [Ralstonia solanacearum CMR15]|nr:hypothethical protein [Ralstonia solanacearum CMR15]
MGTMKDTWWMLTRQYGVEVRSPTVAQLPRGRTLPKPMTALIAWADRGDAQTLRRRTRSGPGAVPGHRPSAAVSEATNRAQDHQSS